MHEVIHIPPEGHRSAKARVTIVYTGGTFGMHYNKEGVLVPFDFSEIQSQLPVISKLALDLTVVSFRHPVDSSNISPRHWIDIAEIIANRYSEADGFVVLHGTDTMAYTASALSFMLEGLSKPVVLTGAQLPISEPRSDARENLINALEIASAQAAGVAAVPEVCIYFNNELLRGNRSRKVQSMQFDAFDSGNLPPLATAGVTIEYNFPIIRKLEGEGSLSLHTRFDSRIAIIRFFPGITEPVVRAAVSTGDLQAIILETYGSGTVPGEEWLYDLLENAIEKGKLVLNVSQCPGARVMQGRYETSKRLLEIGVVGAGDMTLESAVTKLMLLLAEYGVAGARERISVPLAGEISV